MMCNSVPMMPIDIAYLLTVVTAILTGLFSGYLGYSIRSLGR